MHVATLQFSPELGAVEQNMRHAGELLASSSTLAKLTSTDLLVLPEMAFSGYNFPSLASISPFLEPTAAGPTTHWAIKTAKRYRCHIIVGYPELARESVSVSDSNTDLVSARRYNSTVLVSPLGHVLYNYRKSFLYYTDETWASEGPDGTSPPRKPFLCAQTASLGGGLMLGHGICMDINPYRFDAPWSDYEFANAMLSSNAHLVVLSMAWLTRLLPHELSIDPDKPDMETVAYWLARFWPFVEDTSDQPRIVVFANRCGLEGSVPHQDRVEKEELKGEAKDHEQAERVCYAGSSCVMQFHRGHVRMFEKAPGEAAILGKGEEGVLVVDIAEDARILLQRRAA